MSQPYVREGLSEQPLLLRLPQVWDTFLMTPLLSSHLNVVLASSPLQCRQGTPAELLICWHFDQEVCVSSRASNSCSHCQNPVRESGQGHDCNSSVAGETTLLSSLLDSLVVFRKVIISGNRCYQKDYS